MCIYICICVYVYLCSTAASMIEGEKQVTSNEWRPQPPCWALEAFRPRSEPLQVGNQDGHDLQRLVSCICVYTCIHIVT